MRNIVTAARDEWAKGLAETHPRDAPSPNRTPNTDPEFLMHIARRYADIVGDALGFPRLVEPGERLRPGADVHQIDTGNHRQNVGEHSGRDKVTNIHPQILVTSDADAAKAVEWALAQRKHYPKEDNAARRIAGTHAMVVRVEWGRSTKVPYEVDTEPAGVGMLMMLSPRSRERLIAHRGELGSALWAYMQDDRVDDSLEHLAAPLCTPDMLDSRPRTDSGLLLPFMRNASDLPEAWHGNSILPVRHMEDKLHLVRMGLARTTETAKDWERLMRELLVDEAAMIVRDIVGSCATGMTIFGGGKGNEVLPQMVNRKAFDTQARVLRMIREAGDNPLLWRPFVQPASLSDYRIELTDKERAILGVRTAEHEAEVMAIRRYYVIMHPDGTAECIGGFTTVRRNIRVHGANDAIMFVQGPPEGRAK
jgi:hypothetical protein